MSGPNDNENNQEQLRQHAELLENALNIVVGSPTMSQEALLDYVDAYRIRIVAFIAHQLSKVVYATTSLPPLSADSIVISHVSVLKDCGADQVGRMINLFINSVALCNLGHAYFALGSNPESYLVVQMLATMAARNNELPRALDADSITFDVLVDFIRRTDTDSMKTARALRALRDFCALPENTDCAAMRGSVDVVVDTLMRMSNDSNISTGAVRVCEAGVGALRFLLYSRKGRAAFAYHSQGRHVMRAFIGTVSVPITDAAVFSIPTIIHNFPLVYTLQCLELHPEANPSNFSAVAQGIVSSNKGSLLDYIKERALAEDEILSIFQQ